MIEGDLADWAARERQQRQAGVAEHRHDQGVSIPIPKRLEITLYIEGEYFKDINTIKFTEVASKFGANATTVAAIWKGRDNVEPVGAARSPRPAPGPPHRAEDDRGFDIIFHPPRREEKENPVANVTAEERETKEQTKKKKEDKKPSTML